METVNATAGDGEALGFLSFPPGPFLTNHTCVSRQESCLHLEQRASRLHLPRQSQQRTSGSEVEIVCRISRLTNTSPLKENDVAGIDM